MLISSSSRRTWVLSSIGVKPGGAGSSFLGAPCCGLLPCGGALRAEWTTHSAVAGTSLRALRIACCLRPSSLPLRLATFRGEVTVGVRERSEANGDSDAPDGLFGGEVESVREDFSVLWKMLSEGLNSSSAIRVLRRTTPDLLDCKASPDSPVASVAGQE